MRNILVFMIFQMAFQLSHAVSHESIKEETPGKALIQAEELSTEHQRKKASEVLIEALSGSESKAAKKNILSKLTFLTEVFYFNRTQQFFEEAFSLTMTNARLAETKFKEALKLEPDNVSVLRGLARVALSRNQCDLGMSYAKRAKRLNSYSEKNHLMYGLALLCLKDNEAYSIFKKEVASLSKSSNEQIILIIAELRSSFWSEKTIEHWIRQQASPSQDYPEIQYWLWKTAEEAAKKLSYGQAYVSQCKDLSFQQIRKYWLDPELCEKIREVEVALKKHQHTLKENVG